MICNPKGSRTKRHHVFFGLVEDIVRGNQDEKTSCLIQDEKTSCLIRPGRGLYPSLTYLRPCYNTNLCYTEYGSPKQRIRNDPIRARHTEKPSFIISRQGTKRSVCDPHWVSSGLTQKNRRGLLRRRCRPLLRAVQKPASAYACILS